MIAASRSGKRGFFVVPVALVLLLVAIAFVLGMFGANHARSEVRVGPLCTEIGCAPGARIEIGRLPVAAKRIRLCVDGTCTTKKVKRPRSSGKSWTIMLPLRRDLASDPREIRVQVKVLNAKRKVIQRDSDLATPRISYPNGPLCEPPCAQVRGRFSGGELTLFGK